MNSGKENIIFFKGLRVGYDDKGYARIRVDKKYRHCHLIAWEDANGKKPKGYDIHHKNEDPSDFSLENLELLSKVDHRRLHSGWIKTDGKWSHKPCYNCKRILPLESFYKRSNNMRWGDTPCPKCKECNLAIGNLWRENNRDIVNKRQLEKYHERTKK